MKPVAQGLKDPPEEKTRKYTTPCHNKKKNRLILFNKQKEGNEILGLEKRERGLKGEGKGEAGLPG